MFGSARLPRAFAERSAVWDTVNAVLLWSTAIGRCEPIGDKVIRFRWSEERVPFAISRLYIDNSEEALQILRSEKLIGS